MYLITSFHLLLIMLKCLLTLYFILKAYNCGPDTKQIPFYEMSAFWYGHIYYEHERFEAAEVFYFTIFSLPWIRKNDLFACPCRWSPLAFLHGHEVAHVRQNCFEVRHFIANSENDVQFSSILMFTPGNTQTVIGNNNNNNITSVQVNSVYWWEAQYLCRYV